MEYKISLLKRVEEEDLPKLQKSGINLKPLYRILFEKLPKDPYMHSKAKSGDLDGYRGVNWRNGYRLIMRIIESEKIVVVISIDNHDEAYKKAKKRK